VRVKALDSDLDQEAAFNALYSADQADYPCPKGGIFSWENGQIVCSVHDGTEEASSSTVNIGGQTVVITAEAIDNPEIGDRITYKQGDICFIDGTYYILLSGYKNMLVSSKYDSYKAWFTDAMVNMGAAVAVDTKSATPVSGNVTFLKGGSLCSYDNKIYVMDNTSGYISSKNISKLPVFGNVK
jgi:hypothetical protein